LFLSYARQKCHSTPEGRIIFTAFSLKLRRLRRRVVLFVDLRTTSGINVVVIPTLKSTADT